MGGIVIKIEGFQETIEWNAHSATVADFLRLGTLDQLIKMVRENKGDRADGKIIFDPAKKQIIIDTDYFSMPKRAIKFWRALGFDIVLKSTRK